MKHSNEDKSLEFLKLFSQYNCKDITHNVRFIYGNNSLEIKIIKEKLNLKDFSENENEIERILKVLKWSEKNLKFNGRQITSRVYDNFSFFEIIEKVKKQGYKLNCRYLSLLFTQILLSLNFRARWVKCLPVEIISKETHCVTEVYIEELKKWIVVDAPYGLIYFNKSGIPLNLIEMRQNIISGKMFRFFSDSKESIELIYRNWINHIFRFQYSLYNDYDMFKRKKQRFAILNPMNFLSYDELNNQNKFNFFQFDNCEFFLNR